MQTVRLQNHCKMDSEPENSSSLDVSLASQETGSSIENLSDFEEQDRMDALLSETPTGVDEEFIDDATVAGGGDRGVYRMFVDDWDESFIDRANYIARQFDSMAQTSEMVISDDDDSEESIPVSDTNSNASSLEGDGRQPGFTVSTYYGVRTTYVRHCDDNNPYITPEGYINHRCAEIYQEGKLNVIGATMGTGKTYSLKYFIKNYLERNDKMVVYVTPTKFLCRKLASDLGFLCYLDEDGLARWANQADGSKRCSMTICINSLWKLKGCWSKIGLIVFDEFVGCLENIMGNLLTAAKRERVIRMTESLLNPRRGNFPNATAVVMDAMLGAREMVFLWKHVVHEEEDLINVWRYYPAHVGTSLPEMVAITDRNIWIRDLILDLQEKPSDDRLVVMTGMKDYMKDLLSLISNGDDRLMDVMGIELNEQLQQFFWITAETDFEVLREILRDERYLNAPDKNKLAFTPVINSGASFEKNEPYNRGRLISGLHMSPRNILQMCLRCRRYTEGKIFFHLVYKQSEIPFQLDIGLLKQMILNFNQQKKSDRTVMLKACGLERRSRNVISEYFARSIPDDMLDLMAYTMLEQLQFMQDPYGAFTTAMKNNHPLWQISYKQEVFKGTRIDAKFVKQAIAADTTSYSTGLVQARNGSLRCKNPTTFEEKLAYYECCGGISLDQLSVNPKHAANNLDDIKEIILKRFWLCLGHQKLVEQMLLAGTVAKEAYTTIKSELNICSMLRDLFIALGWKAHLCDLGQNTHFISINLLELHSMEITTFLIYSRWKALFTWMEQYRPVLASHTITVLPDASKLCPQPAEITTMTQVVMAVLGLAGIAYKDNSERYQRNGKSYKYRKKINALRAECVSSGMDTYPEYGASNCNQAVTLSDYLVDGLVFRMYADLVMRQEFKTMQGDPFKRVNAYLFDEHIIDRAGPPTVDVQLARKLIEFYKTKLWDDYSLLYETPSFWFVNNPADYDSQSVLERVYDSIRRKVENFWIELQTIPDIETVMDER